MSKIFKKICSNFAYDSSIILKNKSELIEIKHKADQNQYKKLISTTGIRKCYIDLTKNTK